MKIDLGLDAVLQLVGGGRLEGTCEGAITGVASLDQAGPGDLSFLGNLKYRAEVVGCGASLILLPEDYEGTPRPGQAFLRVPNPSWALALVCAEIERQLRPPPPPGIHPSAVVDPGAEVHPEASLGPLCAVAAGARVGPRSLLQAHVYLGAGAGVGEDCRLGPGCSVGAECQIGDRVWLEPGVVIGSEGFGFETVGGEHRRVPQVGRVVLEDDVHVGANSTIDRARFAETRIGRGTKIDNLVQIAHNVTLGRGCLIAAQVGISGSTRVGDHVVAGGQSGVGGHLTVGDGAKLAARTAVLASIGDGAFVRGQPAYPIHAENRLIVLRRRLPDLFRRVARLEDRIGAETGSASPDPNCGVKSE